MRSEDETPPHDTLEAAKAAEPRSRSGMMLIPWFVLLAVVLIGAPFSTYAITKAHGERDSAIAQRDVYAGQAEQLKEQVKSLGAQPVVTPSPVPSTQPTANSMSSDEVRSVVTDELSRYKLTVTPSEVNQIARTAAALIPKPKDGRTPTPQELQRYASIAVSSYCLEDRCVKKPKDGKDGVDGKPGADAPKVTDEELLRAAKAALDSFCAQESKPCTPKDGVDGKPGVDGQDGRGIVSGPTCTGEGSESYWLTKYTDGTEQRQDGPCRTALLPAVKPK